MYEGIFTRGQANISIKETVGESKGICELKEKRVRMKKGKRNDLRTSGGGVYAKDIQNMVARGNGWLRQQLWAGVTEKGERKNGDGRGNEVDLNGAETKLDRGADHHLPRPKRGGGGKRENSDGKDLTDSWKKKVGLAWGTSHGKGERTWPSLEATKKLTQRKN